MRETIDAEIAFERGEALVLIGDVDAGLQELRRAGARTAQPGVACRADRHAPLAARRIAVHALANGGRPPRPTYFSPTQDEAS